MTAKQLQHLGELHARLSAGTFSETDVSALLVLLREKSRGGPILELAHSIVHSERDSGLFFKRMKENRDSLNNLGRKSGTVRSCEIISSDDFAQNLDDTFARYGLSSLGRPLDDLIFLWGLSLLQGGSVRAGKRFGELSLVLTSERFELHATIQVKHQGQEVRVAFPVASVANRWIPVCNPRAHLSAQGSVQVTAVNSSPVVEGFKPFEVYIEREPPIAGIDVRDLAAGLGLIEQESTLAYAPADRPVMVLRYDGRRLTVPGLPDFFRVGSDYELILKRVRLSLGACVHDDAGAHWFLEGLGIAPDGFHCHWVGKGFCYLHSACLSVTIAIGNRFGDRIVLMSDTMVSDRTAVRPNLIPGVLKTIVLSTSCSVAFAGLVSQGIDSIRTLRHQFARGIALRDAEEFLRAETLRLNNKVEFLIASHMPDARLAKVSGGAVSAGLSRYWIGDPQIADEIHRLMEDGRAGSGGEYWTEEEMRFRSAFEELVQEKYHGAVGGNRI